MTIIEAINAADKRKPNTLSKSEKIRLLSYLDGKIKLEIIDTHEGGKAFQPYTEDTPMNTELLVPFPWDDLYIKYLICEIDLHAGDIERYNNGVAVYNEAYEAFTAWYNRTHMPRSPRVSYF